MNYCVFDAHCDTAMELFLRAQPLAQNHLAVSLARAAKLPGYAQMFAFCTVWVQDGRTDEELFHAAFDNFCAEIRKNSAKAALCTCAQDAEAAMQAGKAAAFLSLEGAEPIACDPGRLDEAYALGIRMIAPCWNAENALTGSCVTGGGLTAQGREFCRRAQKLGIVLDVSHMSERGFWDLTEIVEKPIAASHSNSRALCPHIRNLTDDQFRAIVQLGGAAGLNLYAPFLAGQTATVDDAVRHIDHWMELGGDGHAALGADFDGCDALPEGITGIDDYEKLSSALARRGYAADTLRRLFSETWMEVLKTCAM